MDAQENPGFWALVVILIGIVGLSGGGWYYANVVRHDAPVVDHTPSKPDLKVVAITADRVTPRVTSRAKTDGSWTKAGIWGLEWDAGYAQVGTILEVNDQEVVREFLHVTGDLSIGDLVRVESLSHKPGSVSDIVNKSHLVAITDLNLCVLRQLSSPL